VNINNFIYKFGQIKLNFNWLSQILKLHLFWDRVSAIMLYEYIEKFYSYKNILK
jgi:hypothetical protein